MNKKRVRQRLEYFEKAFGELEKAVEIVEPSFVELAGIVQLFNVCLEMTWKYLKEILRLEGEDPSTVREVVKMAYAAGLIDDGKVVMDAIYFRNFLAHNYDNELAEDAFKKIKSVFFPVLQKILEDAKSR